LVFFLGFEVTYPTIFEGSDHHGAFFYPIYHHLEDIGGMKFQGGRIDESI
jgi:hypothetical protein